VILSDQKIKSKIRRSNWLGTKATARSRRRCTHRFSTATETRLWKRFCGRIGAAAPTSWARDCPPGPLPLVPINTPLGGSSGRYPEFRVLLLLKLHLGGE